MAQFKSYLSYRHFAQSIATAWRFSRPPEQAEFLQTVLETSVSRQQVVKAGHIFWRAQLGYDVRNETEDGFEPESAPCAFSPERMKPLIDRGWEGRANPKGIAYLYLATKKETAIGEVRPLVGSYVSLAQLALTRDVRLVDCVSNDSRMMVRNYEPEPEERERDVWQDIDHAFSKPVTSTDDTADYAPTQVLAEFFREKQLDGIAYGSSLGPGHNVALFDPGAARVVGCGLQQINCITLEFSMADNPYVVTDPSTEKSGNPRVE